MRAARYPRRVASMLLCAAGCSFGRLEAAEFRAADFGAVGDGATDSTAAIQKAIDAAGSAGGGRVVLAPADRPYLVRKTLVVGSSNVEIVGSGATLLRAEGTVASSRDHTLLVAGGEKTGVENVIVRGLTIDANFWNQTPKPNSKPRGLLVERVRKVLLEDVHVRRAWVSLAFQSGTEDADVRDCTVSDWHNDGFDASEATRIRFVRCRAFGAMSGNQGGPPGGRDGAWEIEDGANHVTLIDCVVERTSAIGFKVRNHAPMRRTHDIRLVRCRVAAPARRALHVTGRHPKAKGRQVDGVFLEDCRFEVGATFDCDADRIEIAGGQFAALFLSDVARVSVTGARVEKITIKTGEATDVVLADVALPPDGLVVRGEAAKVQRRDAGGP